MKKRSKYKGELAKPIVLDPYFAIALSIVAKKGAQPDKEQEEIIRRRRDAWILLARGRKLALLLEHFGISESAKHVWLQLALALAQEHVPGMEINSLRKKGRPARRPSSLEIRMAVHTVLFERDHGVSDAIRILQKREPERWGKFKFADLRNRYYEAMKDLPKDASFVEQDRAMLSGISDE